MSKKLILSCLVVCFIMGTAGILYAGLLGGSGSGDLAVKLTCPATVKAGTVLNVTAVVENNNCTSAKSFVRVYTGMTGNPGTTLAGYGFWGPFVRNVATVTVPKATCDEWGDVITPGTKNVGSVKIVDSVPATLVGKLADAFWGPLMAGGVAESQGLCGVQVVQ